MIRKPKIICASVSMEEFVDQLSSEWIIIARPWLPRFLRKHDIPYIRIKPGHLSKAKYAIRICDLYLYTINITLYDQCRAKAKQKKEYIKGIMSTYKAQQVK